MTTTDAQEYGWRNRCSTSSSLYSFETMSIPSQRTPAEKFQMQARHAAILLGFPDRGDQGDHFFKEVVEIAKNYETLNGGALALVYHIGYGGKSDHTLEEDKLKAFFKNFDHLNKNLQKFNEEFGIKGPDLIRYVRFFNDTIAPKLN